MSGRKVKLPCTCGVGQVKLCPSCIQLKVLTPAQLRESEPLIKTDQDIARERYERKLRKDHHD